MSVQNVVEDLRQTGLTDVQIASEIGCGISTVNMWGNGHRAKRTGDYLFKLFQLHQRRCLRADTEPRGAASESATSHRAVA